MVVPYFPATCPCNISPYRHLNNKVQSDHIVVTKAKDSNSVYVFEGPTVSLLHRRETSNGRRWREPNGLGNLVLKFYRSRKIKLNFLPFFFKDIFSLNATALHQDGRVVKALDLRSNGRVVRVGSNPTPGNSFFTIILQPKHESLIQTLQILSRNFGFKVELLQNIGAFLSSHDVQNNSFYDFFHLDVQERVASLM